MYHLVYLLMPLKKNSTTPAVLVRYILGELTISTRPVVIRFQHAAGFQGVRSCTIALAFNAGTLQWRYDTVAACTCFKFHGIRIRSAAGAQGHQMSTKCVATKCAAFVQLQIYHINMATSSGGASWNSNSNSIEFEARARSDRVVPP